MPQVTPFLHPQPQRHPIQIWHLVVLVAVSVLGWFAVKYFMLVDNYNKGNEAYEAADCETAIVHFSLVINGPKQVDFDDYAARASAKKVECQAFQKVINQQKTGTIEIRNDSPTKMRLVFSGPEPRFEELAPCLDCITYVGQGPKTCPNKGLVGRYTLKPGQYDVVVKSISDRRVRPYTGNWSLDDATEYNHCFFIVQKPETEPQRK